jgi:transcriptional regulator with XRE-family HTH domain
MPAEFHQLLKALRLIAGYGLREFAEMVGDAPSNYAGVESGDRPPWRDPMKLERVADHLGLAIGSPERDNFILAGRRKGRLPDKFEEMLDRPAIPLLLRTVDELQLSDAELKRLVERLRRAHRKSKE